MSACGNARDEDVLNYFHHKETSVVFLCFCKTIFLLLNVQVQKSLPFN